jgi:hypothetical protein
MPSLAYNFGFNLNYLSQKIKIQYKQIGPQFNSLANPFIKKNVKEWSFENRFRALENKLFFNIKSSFANDGFSEIDKIVTYNDKYNLNVSFYPGIGLPTFNLNWGVSYKNNGNDVVKITYEDEDGRMFFPDDSQTDQLNISISGKVGSFTKHSISLNHFKSDLIDFTALDSLYTSKGYISKRNSSSSTSLSLSSKVSKSTRTLLSLSFNNYNFGKERTDYFQEQSIYSLTTQYAYKFTNYIDLKSSINFIKGMGVSAFNQWNFGFGLKFLVLKKINVKFDSVYQYKSKGSEGNGNVNSIVSVNYNL